MNFTCFIFKLSFDVATRKLNPIPGLPSLMAGLLLHQPELWQDLGSLTSAPPRPPEMVSAYRAWETQTP